MSDGTGVTHLIYTDLTHPGITHGSKALQVTWSSASAGVETVTFAAQNWNWDSGTAGAAALAMDVYNSGTTDLPVVVHAGDGGTNGFIGTATVPAGSSTTLIMPLTSSGRHWNIENPLGFGLGIPSGPFPCQTYPATGPSSGFPNNLYLQATGATLNTNYLNTGAMTNITVGLGAITPFPTPAPVLVIDNIHLVPSVTTETSGAWSPLIVNDFATTAEQSLVSRTSGGVTFSFTTSGSTTSLNIDWPANSNVSYPNVAIKTTNQVGSPAAADWMGGGAVALAIDVTNPGTAPINAILRVDDPYESGGYKHCREVQVAVPANTTTPTTAVVPLYSLDLLDNLGLTGCFPDANLTTSAGANGFDLQHVVKFNIFINNSGNSQVDQKLSFSNARMITGNALLACVDHYGQFNKGDWPGKHYVDSDFASQVTAENTDLTNNPGLPNLDTYGGWVGTGSPHLTPTTYFTVQNINHNATKWWLVDPMGNLFYTVGIGAMSIQGYAPSPSATTGATFVKGTPAGSLDRTYMFTGLPSVTDPTYGVFWGTASAISGPFTGGASCYNFYLANLYRKFSSSYATTWQTMAEQRLKSWGFNTIGNFSQNFSPNNVPYTARLGYYSNHKTIPIPASLIQWGPMPDPWDAQFATDCYNRFNNTMGPYKTDPNCIGYVVDNELSWGNRTATGAQKRYLVAYGTMLADISGGNSASPAKAQFIAQLQTIYPTIAAFNSSWGTSFTGWTDVNLLKPYTIPDTGLSSTEIADLTYYQYKYAVQYFYTVRYELKRLDPNHLYLGCGFGNTSWTTECVNAAAQYCDVMNFHIYQTSIDQDTTYNFLDSSRVYTPPVGAPITIPSRACYVGEFQFASPDRGVFGSSLVATTTTADKAAAYMNYIEELKTHSSFVGCHWFEYIDEPATGDIGTQENSAIGFVSVTDTPYPEMVNAARTEHLTLYDRY